LPTNDRSRPFLRQSGSYYPTPPSVRIARTTREAGGFLADRREDFIERLKAVEKRYRGLDRIIAPTPLGTPLDVQLEGP
jgi:hypothetical protein